MNNSTVEMEQNNAPENMEQPTAPQYKPPKILTRKTKRMIFYISMVALPFIQFLIFYVYVNIDSILMAFRVTYLDEAKGTYEEYWSLTANFKGVFNFLKYREWLPVLNALKVYAITFLTSGIFSIFFSYYVYKKFMLSGLFKIFLYLPSMVSAVVMTLVFRTICNSVIPGMIYESTGESITPFLMGDSTFGFLIGYSIFFSLGGHILMYTGTMSGINDSVVESAQLDGVNAIQEFWYITLPLIWPTFTTFTVTGLAGIFTNQLGLHTFYGDGAPQEVSTLGYEIFVWTKKGSIIGNQTDINDPSRGLILSEISATGFLIMAVVLPVSMGLKKLMTKLGPSAD